MKKIRIGNDIRVEWTLLRNGEAESLEGRDISVSLLCDANRKSQVIDWEVHDNVIHVTFKGKDQTTTGKYSLVATENAGKDDMHTLDHADAIQLVDRSWKVVGGHDENECSNIEVITVELTDDLAYAKDGKSAYEIAVEHGYEGTEEEFAQGLIDANMAKPLAQEALRQIDETTFRVYRDGGYNMDRCLWYGWWFGCVLGRPAGSVEGEQYAVEVVNCGTTLYTPADGVQQQFMVIKQTCHSTLEKDKTFRRMILTTDRNKYDPPFTYYGEWERLEAPIEYIENLN